ncbi:glycosyltransferase family 4 protein [bacterium]|nr:glycosyltransferase family 4 protein [bacterium]
MNNKNNQKKILYFVGDDWFFVSHRLPLAKTAIEAGYEVAVATRDQKHGHKIREAGIKLIPLQRYSKRSFNPLNALLAWLEIVRIIKWYKPDLLHNITIRPILYGTLASRFFPRLKLINAFTGLGYLFSEQRPKVKLLRKIITLMLMVFTPHKRSLTIFQNFDDLREFVQGRVVKKDNAVLIKGSGVSLRDFPFAEEKDGIPIVILASRLLWNKGVGDFVEAAKILKEKAVLCRMVLVGSPDMENPMGIPEGTLSQWAEQGIVEWWGFQENMADVLRKSHVVCLPTTYREGVPKILIEAAASGRAIVATDMPGCRDIVKDGENGTLTPPSNPEKLAEAIENLVSYKSLRKRMGKNGRTLVEKEFTVERVNESTLNLYQTLLSDI